MWVWLPGNGSHGEENISPSELAVCYRKGGPKPKKGGASVSELQKERYANKDPKGGHWVTVQLASGSLQSRHQLISEV